MTDPAALLSRLRDQGLSLRADGGTLVVSPSSEITEAQAALLRKHKPALLALLAMEKAVLDYDRDHDTLEPVVLLDARLRDRDPPRYVAVNADAWASYERDLRLWCRLHEKRPLAKKGGKWRQRQETLNWDAREV